MTRLLSLAHLTAIKLTPPELIRAAAAAGFDAVGLRLVRVTDASPGYPLMHDAAMMRETKAALFETGLTVHDIEFVKIEPGTDVSALLSFLDAGAELGAHEVIAAPYDPVLSRLTDRLGALSERATERGLGTSLEFFPWTVVPDLDAAITLTSDAGPDVGILVDSLHFNRSGSELDALRSLPAGKVRFAHLCDALVHPPYSTEDLLNAGRAERLPPGFGEIPLTDFLGALPSDLPLAIEVPMSALSEAEGPDAVIRRVMSATRRLLAEEETPRHN